LTNALGMGQELAQSEFGGEAAAHGKELGSTELARGWKPLVACAAGIGLGTSGLQTFTAGVFAVALERQFGWSRSQILSAVLLQTAAIFFVGPFVGKLADRIGARPIAICSTIALGLGTAAFSLITSHIWTFYLAYGLMSLGSLGTLPPIYAKVLSLWFDRRRGLAMGLALSVTGISGMVLPIYVQTLIGSVGWRGAYVGLGLVPIVIALPCILLLLPRGLGPGEGSPLSAPIPEIVAGDGLSVRSGLGSYRYWLMAVIALATGIGLTGILFNLVPMLIDRGFKPAEAATIFGIYGLVVVLGRLLTGWLLDRFWAPAIGCCFLIGPCLGTLLLRSGTGSAGVVALAVVLLALSSGSELDLLAYMTSRYFGRRNFSVLYSGQYAFFVVGAAGAPLFAAIHDVYGSYGSILTVTSALFAVSAAAILTLGRYPHFAVTPATG
jgi:MFS family permease